MTDSIKLVISNEVHEITIKEYQGNRVVTFRDIDVLHRRKTGAARKAFNSYKDQFVENEDYFVLNTDEAFKLFGIKAPNGMILVAESGYPMVIKTFSDELSWQVHRQLVKAYFKIKQAHMEQKVPTSYEDIMIFALQSQKEMKSEIALLKQDKQEQSAEIRKLSLVVDNEIHLNDNQLAAVQEAVKHRVGELSKQGYEKHFQSIFSALKVFFSVPKYNKIKRGDFDKAIDFINGWYPKKDETAN